MDAERSEEQIKKHIEELYPGRIFKNFKELFTVLEMPYVEGKQKILFQKTLSRYCTYHKEGHKIIIDEVLDKPISRPSGNHVLYADSIEFLLMDILIDRPDILKRKSLGTICYQLGIYRYLNNDDMSRILFYTIERSYRNIGKNSFDVWFNDIDSHIYQREKTLLTQCLNRMQKEGIITWNQDIYFIDKYNNRYPMAGNTKLTEIYNEAIKHATEKTGYNFKSSNIMNRKKREEYYESIKDYITESTEERFVDVKKLATVEENDPTKSKFYRVFINPKTGRYWSRHDYWEHVREPSIKTAVKLRMVMMDNIVTKYVKNKLKKQVEAIQAKKEADEAKKETDDIWFDLWIDTASYVSGRYGEKYGDLIEDTSSFDAEGFLKALEKEEDKNEDLKNNLKNYIEKIKIEIEKTKQVKSINFILPLYGYRENKSVEDTIAIMLEIGRYILGLKYFSYEELRQENSQDEVTVPDDLQDNDLENMFESLEEPTNVDDD